MGQKEHIHSTLETLFQCAPEAVFVTDRKWQIVLMNPLAETMTGCISKTSIGNQLMDVLKLFDSQKKETFKLTSYRQSSGDKQTCNYWNLVLSPANGSDLRVDCSISPLNATKHAQGGYLVILKNVDDRALIDDEYINHSKISAIANMASSLAHDFTNSLGAISGHASAIADNLIPNTRAHEEALRILEAAKRAGNLTKHLMSIARIGDSKTDMKVEAIHLGNVAKDAITIMEESFSSQNIVFKIKSPESMPYVMADDRQLLDCLVNLMINSTDAMSKGGTISIDSDELIFRKTTYVALRIRDTGNGMAKDVLLRAFDPFFSTKPLGTGAGLGLTVVKNSLERWGGSVKIRSRVGTGTSVRLFFRKAKAQPSKEYIRESKSGGENILLIDDAAVILEKSAQILRNEGYNVYTAKSGEEGLRMYQKHVDDIDLAIIDLVMPKINGKKVLEGILEFNPTASIIMMSGFSRDYVRTSLERGAWGYVQKPFTAVHLLAVVRKILDQNVAVNSEK